MTHHHFFSEHPFCAAGPLGVLPLACTWPSACHCSAEAPEASRESAVARAHPGSPWASLLARTPCHPTEPLLLLNCPRLIRLSKLRTPGGTGGSLGLAARVRRRGWPCSRHGCRPSAVEGWLVKVP